MSTITITFRTKKTEFSGGGGYKSSRMLLPKHYAYSGDLKEVQPHQATGGTLRWSTGCWARPVTSSPRLCGVNPRYLSTANAEKANEELQKWTITPGGTGSWLTMSRTLRDLRKAADPAFGRGVSLPTAGVDLTTKTHDEQET